jgi:hypothetical protein
MAQSAAPLPLQPTAQQTAPSLQPTAQQAASAYGSSAFGQQPSAAQDVPFVPTPTATAESVTQGISPAMQGAPVAIPGAATASGAAAYASEATALGAVTSAASYAAEAATPAASPYAAGPATSGVATAPNVATAPHVPIQKPARRKNKKLPMIIGIVVAVVVVVGGVAGFLFWQESDRSQRYESAQLALYAGNYVSALEGFVGLGDYKDSKDMATVSQDHLDYQTALDQLEAGDRDAAKTALTGLSGMTADSLLAADCSNVLTYIGALELYDAGDFAGAKEKLRTVATSGVPGVSDFTNKCDYALADAELAAGHNYAAYKAFLALGSYSDAAARAESCKLPNPYTGELWHNPDYSSTASSIKIDCTNASSAHYYKVYEGDTLVAQIFINGGSAHELEVPAGNYTIKEGTGDMWFGPDDAFGEKGDYEIMTFEGGSTTYNLGDNRIVTITLNASGDGNSVGGKDTDFSNF